MRAAPARGRRCRAARRRSCSATLARRCTRAASGGSSARPTGSPRGDFDEPVVDEGDDELGELARAFDRMRVQLAQLDRARKEFIANASHELRTPLFSLGGFLELMTDEELDEETRREFLATMREQVDRLTKLATDLLDLSRVDAGRLRVEREPVDLGAARARRSPRSSGRSPRRATTSSSVEIEGEPVALGDEERVLQVGRALAGNALMHTPPGHARHRARLDARRVARSSPSRTTGPGIPAEQRRARLRSLLPRRGRCRLGQRARARDRARAGGADGRCVDARVAAGPHDLHASRWRADGERAANRSRRAFSRENGQRRLQWPHARRGTRRRRPRRRRARTARALIARQRRRVGRRRRRGVEPTVVVDASGPASGPAGSGAASPLVGDRLRPRRDLRTQHARRRHDLRPLRRTAGARRAPASSSRTTATC